MYKVDISIFGSEHSNLKSVLHSDSDNHKLNQGYVLQDDHRHTRDEQPLPCHSLLQESKASA